MLQDVIKRGTGRRALALGRPIWQGKTGTTNESKDAWFSGYNADYVTTVWTGFDQPESLGRREYGGTVALPIWMSYMGGALRQTCAHPGRTGRHPQPAHRPGQRPRGLTGHGRLLRTVQKRRHAADQQRTGQHPGTGQPAASRRRGANRSLLTKSVGGLAASGTLHAACS
jgi:membrane carboxypeptidase/penicillin-binding protein